MPLLTLQPFGAGGPTTIPCFRIPITGSYERFGDEDAAWDGTQLTRRRAKKRNWPLRTPLLPYAESTTLLAVLEGTLPMASGGDLIGSDSVIVIVLGETVDTLGDGSLVRSFDFVVREE